MNLKKPRILVAATLLGAAGISLALPVMPALGQSSNPTEAIRLKSPAQAVDRGAVVFAPVQIVCDSGQQSFVSVNLSERFGKELAVGSGFAQPICTGGFQTVKVPVTPQNAVPFTAGSAYGMASMTVCEQVCGNASDQRTVKVVNK